MVRRSSVVWLVRVRREGRKLVPLVALVVLWACGPNGAAAFHAGQLALEQSDHLTWTVAATSPLGVVTDTTELDCTHVYYHHIAALDLTPLGLEHGRTVNHGAPRAHQETEVLLVNGHTYQRHTPAWTTASGATNPDWVQPRVEHLILVDCAALHHGQDYPLVPFSRIGTVDPPVFVATRTVAGVSCHDYSVEYEELVDPNVPPSTTFSLAPPAGSDIGKVVQAQICLATSDDRPVRAIAEHRSTMFSYAPIAPLPDPLVH